MLHKYFFDVALKTVSLLFEFPQLHIKIIAYVTCARIFNPPATQSLPVHLCTATSPMQLSVCAQFISFAAELFPTAANNTFRRASAPHRNVGPPQFPAFVFLCHIFLFFSFFPLCYCWTANTLFRLIYWLAAGFALAPKEDASVPQWHSTGRLTTAIAA